MSRLPLEIERESWPTGGVHERTVDEVDLCAVRRFDTDTPAERRMAELLERANRRAVKRWRAQNKPGDRTTW
jgi:hypothetical protein